MRLETRRTLGAFYTPANLAALVASWAIDDQDLRVLEPSVGSGSLLDAIAARLTEVGGGSVVGYEIDTPTMQRLGRFSDTPSVQVLNADFFDIDGAGDFDVVVANPPFTRNHLLKADVRRKLKLRPEAVGVVSGAPGLWVYFILATLQHLRLGGRIVFVLPGAAEFADYADRMLQHLCAEFVSVELISIDDAIMWEGKAQERASVLIAKGYRSGAAACVVRRHATTDGLIGEGTFSGRPIPTTSHAVLGAIARIEIGAVTGANDIFLLSHDQAIKSGIDPDDFRLAVARARQVRGIAVTADELGASARTGERTLLLAPRQLGPRGGAVRSYLAQIDRHRRRNTLWLNKRSPWWLVQLGNPADAVLTYMNHFGPKLTLIEAGLAATNTVHKLSFLSRQISDHRTAAVSMLTTYTQAHAEMIGRVYGGGVLKFELKDARKLPLLLPETGVSSAVFARVDTALKSGALETARGLADAAIMPKFFGAGWQEVQAELASRLLEARTLRNSRAGKR